MKLLRIICIVFLLTVCIACNTKFPKAADIIGNPNYQAIAYGGYRGKTRDKQPTIAQLKEDMRILYAMNIKLLRTYNVHFVHAENLLKAINELKKEDSKFEMYVMLGAWIDCRNAWTDKKRNHNAENKHNELEIKKAVDLAKQYPEIVKIISVGNEVMVHWADYHVHPSIVLKWVKYLQDLKRKGDLPKDLWITSSDNYASWGGGDTSYHCKDLENLIDKVDFISMHTYPMHNTYYNPDFWLVPKKEAHLSDKQKIDAAMKRALKFAQKQYKAVQAYVDSLGYNKTVHIGETGWATISDGFYGSKDSRAADEYKAGLYYKMIRNWTNKEHITCFYFEAFDEQWKAASNPNDAENHFGLINLKGQAKYSIWENVDKGDFDLLTRDGNSIKKTYNGNVKNLLKEILPPPSQEYKGFKSNEKK